MQPPRSPPLPPPMGMGIQELCSPPLCGWVGGGGGGVAVSSRNGYGYTGAMFPAPPVGG